MARVSKEEFQWREWVLGEGRYAGKGARSQPRPPFGYGAFGEEPIPEQWWKRLEAFITRRDDKHETPGEPQPRKTPEANKAPAPPGQLSAHFHVSEFRCHDGRPVPVAAVAALRRLCVMYLEAVRAEFGPVKILSGYRPRDYNARIGGAKFSQHIYDLTPSSVAADFTCARGTPAQWYAFLNRLGPGGLGKYPGFVHVDNRPGKARWTG